jgi:hypothetical protein
MPEQPGPEDAEPKVIAMDDLAQTRIAVIHAKAKAKEWTQIAEAGMTAIKERLADADEGTIDGRPVVRRVVRTVTRVNAKALRADLPPEVLAPYLTTNTETRYELETEVDR